MNDTENNPAADKSEADLAAELNEPSETTFVAESSSPGRNLPLLLIGLVLFGAATIYLMRLKTGPATAAAASAEATKANTTINEFLTGGQKNVSQMRETLKNTQKIVDGFLNQSQTHHVDVQELPSNPFFFGFEKPKVAQNAGVTDKQLEEMKNAEKTKIRQAVEKLKLTTIVGGSAPSCMINGRLYKEGQEVASFTINKINAKSVVVSKPGEYANYAFELQMNPLAP